MGGGSLNTWAGALSTQRAVHTTTRVNALAQPARRTEARRQARRPGPTDFFIILPITRDAGRCSYVDRIRVSNANLKLDGPQYAMVCSINIVCGRACTE